MTEAIVRVQCHVRPDNALLKVCAYSTLVVAAFILYTAKYVNLRIRFRSEPLVNSLIEAIVPVYCRVCQFNASIYVHV